MNPAISTEERRRRIGVRHALVPACAVEDAVSAARSTVCLHGTDPSTVYVSAWARVPKFERPQMSAALYDERSLLKHMAMRRTLHVFPIDTVPAAQAAASVRVAEAERRRVVKQVEKAGLFENGQRWLDRTRAAVLEALVGREASYSELKAELPDLAKTIMHGEGRSWGGPVPIGPQVITILSAEGAIVRASNDGSWNVSRNRWALTEDWLGAPIRDMTAAEGTAALTREWLRCFGPGTIDDIKWWMKSTVAAVKQALTDLEAVAVEIDGRSGWVLPDDVDDTPDTGDWVALLPPLDSTTMAWTHRDWYLGDHKSQIFDSVGNAGPTVWHNGHIVGGWAQRANGEVVTKLLEDIGGEARGAVDAKAAALTEWFDGKRVLIRFPSPLSKSLATDG